MGTIKGLTDYFSGHINIHFSHAGGDLHEIDITFNVEPGQWEKKGEKDKLKKLLEMLSCMVEEKMDLLNSKIDNKDEYKKLPYVFWENQKIVFDPKAKRYTSE